MFLGWPSSVRKPENRRYCVASNLFLFKNTGSEIPLKQFFEHSASKFITARK